MGEIAGNLPHLRDMLFVPILLAAVVTFLRRFVSWFVARPLGIYLGVQTSPRDDCANFRTFFKRRTPTRSLTSLDKFYETFWKFAYHCGIFVIGFAILWREPWIYDTRELWRGYPLHPVSRGMWWYFLFQAGQYWSLTFSQLTTDVRRKDFRMMIIHHVATLIVMTIAWYGNFVRVGCLVLLIHDPADFCLEIPKMAKLTGLNRMPGFVLFFLVWIYTRLWLFPFRVIYSCLFELPQFIEWNGPAISAIVCLCLLQVLHLIWSKMLFQATYDVLVNKTGPDDVRSDDECDDD